MQAQEKPKAAPADTVVAKATLFQWEQAQIQEEQTMIDRLKQSIDRRIGRLQAWQADQRDSVIVTKEFLRQNYANLPK